MKIKYFIKWSFKQFRAFPMQTLINLLGMSIGFTVFALIVLYVYHQKNVDTFHSNLDNIYRAENNFYGITPATYLDFYGSQIPEIESGCRIGISEGLLSYQPNGVKEIRQGIYVEAILTDFNFFNVFSYQLLTSVTADDYKNPNSVILNESISKKLFGEENPINKTVKFDGENELTVIGVMKDFSGNSSLSCDVIMPFDFYSVWRDDPNYHDNWYRWAYETYFLLNKSVSSNDVKAKMDSILVERYVKEFNAPREDAVNGVNQILRPYKEIYLSEISDNHSHGKKSHILIFSIIAAFVLLIACINYVNISTAIASNRFKTLAIKRVGGATRQNLIRLILSEGILTAFLSVVLSVLFIEFSLPYFKELTGLDIQIPYSISLVLFIILGVPVILGTLAAIYPSYYITNFDLVSVLKGELISGKSGSAFRKVLTIIQFSISVFLIIGTLSVKKQLSFISSNDPGYEMEQVAYTSLNPIIQDHFDVLKSRMLENPDILGITRSSSKINSIGNVSTMHDGEEKSLTVPYLVTDEDFFDFFDIDIIWGKSFNSNDVNKESKPFIINKKMAEWYGGIDTIPSKKIWDREIVGVIENVQINSLHQDLQPMVIELNPSSSSYMYYKIKAGTYKETIKFINEIWVEIAPQFPFEYQFLEDDFENLYKSEIQFSKVFLIFGLISIFIACIGLFAMTSFMALKRTKEIGIRKSHGASTLQIVLLLSKELTTWVLIANFIAIPCAILYLKNWLNSFAYKTPLSWWIFVLSILISLVIALITICYYAINTARKNPVESLRYE